MLSSPSSHSFTKKTYLNAISVTEWRERKVATENLSRISTRNVFRTRNLRTNLEHENNCDPGREQGFRRFQRPLELPPSAKVRVTVELRGQVNKSLKMRQMGR